MKITNAIKSICALRKFNIESTGDIIVYRIHKLLYGRQKAANIKRLKQYELLKKKYLKDNIWDFNGVKFPDYPKNKEGIYMVYLDTLFSYCNCNDNYDSTLVDQLDLCLPEGTYGYKNDEIDVTVKPGDVVFDAGAWIGDFSAYASVKGAEVFSFEPGKEMLDYLKVTQQLNKNIHIVEKGLSDKTETAFLSYGVNSGSNKVSVEDANAEKIELITIDEFVAENNIQKVDFIKADIEGAERYMLLGATKTLKEFAPKLAICTYHLKDDPQVLAKIILDANPDYTIVQKKMKLYAMVKKQ